MLNLAVIIEVCRLRPANHTERGVFLDSEDAGPGAIGTDSVAGPPAETIYLGFLDRIETRHRRARAERVDRNELDITPVVHHQDQQ